MSDQNKQLARRFLQAFEAGDVATLEQIVAPDMVDHNSPPGAKPGRPGLLDAVAMFHSGFPDMKISIDRVVAEGDSVAVYGKVSGMNTGVLMGTAPTGKRASFAYMDIYRIVDGRVVESWHVEDIAGMLKQLGLFPE